MRLSHKAVTASLCCVLALAACQRDADPSIALGQSRTARAQPAPQVAEQNTYEGPFGLQMGLSLDEVKTVIPGISSSDNVPLVYHANSVPSPHPDFESYMLVISRASGLCKVVAIGKSISSGNTGQEVRSAFDSLDEAISSKYGKGKKYDYSTDRDESPEYWMMYLLKKNRTLAKYWDKNEGSTLTNDIGFISLEAGATRIDTGHLMLGYEFLNMPDCVAESKAQKHKSL